MGVWAKSSDFDQHQINYLKTLDVVHNVTAKRITYTDDFKRSCLTRYYQGESPVAIFREAGLPPEIIGYKRIERCFARWRGQSKELLGKNMEKLAAHDSGEGAQSPNESAGADKPASERPTNGRQTATAVAPSSPDSTTDDEALKDLIIEQQVHYITQLEKQVSDLQHSLSAVLADSHNGLRDDSPAAPSGRKHKD